MVRTERARRSFRAFVELAWQTVEPADEFVPGMHVDALSQHLQAVLEGEIQNLCVCVPPGTAKSLISSVLFPAWCWIDHPELRFLFASYSQQLSTRDSVRCRRLIESPWYQERWGSLFKLESDQNEKRRFENDKSGIRISTSVGGTATGERAGLILVDDALSVDQADSEVARESAVDWFFGTMPSRLNNPQTGHRIVIQQRLHEADIVGEIIRRQSGFEILSLPAEFDSRERSRTSIWMDPRQVDGELLWPARLSQPTLDNLRKDLGSSRYAAQYNQKPAPAGGHLWKRPWFKFYRRAELPTLTKIIGSWDATFKDSKDSDYVSGQIWGVDKANRYLLDRFHAQADFVKTVAAIRAMNAKYPLANATLVEAAANGHAILSYLKAQIPGLIGITPDGSKISRASAVAPLFESGQIWVPHPDECPWIEEVLAEWASFPSGAHDDDVDSCSMALNWLRKNTFTRTITLP